MRKKTKTLSAEAWNAIYPPGTPVEVSPILLEPPAYKTRTRSAAWIVGSGDALVSIEGKTGGYWLDALRVLTEEEYVQSKLPLP